MAIPPRRSSSRFVATEDEVFFLPWQDDRPVDLAAKNTRQEGTASPRSADIGLVNSPPIHAIGIDFGIKHSCISYLNEHGEPITIPNGVGELSIPTAVMFDVDRAIVGTKVLRSVAAHPDKVVVNVQRYMANPSHRWKINGQSYSPVDISAIILRSMLDHARERIGAINQAVITIPAGCSDVQRQATVEAGRRAGLTRVDIVEEPVAATLCFVLGTEGIWFTNLATSQTVMVVNLADDTFDVSLVHFQKGEVRVIASAGDARLGELDWNKTLEVAVAQQFRKEFGIDPLRDRQAAQTLALEAEQAIRSLSVRPQAALTCAAGGQRKTYQVERDQFERLTKDLVDRMELVTLDMLKQSHSGFANIDVVLATGGASRMPMVRDRLKRLSGRTLNTSLSPDQSIAHGATYYAGMLLTNSAFAKAVQTASASSAKNISEQQKSSVEPFPKTAHAPVVQPDTRFDAFFRSSSSRAASSPTQDAKKTATPKVEVRTNNLANQNRWDAIIQSHTSADAWALIPVSKLARDIGIQARLQLNDAECRLLLATADQLGFALEPDARITGTCYEWYELVSVFPLDDALAGELASYRAASTLLRLGITVALADGEVDEAEMTRLFSHLKTLFTLSEHDAVRLDHLRYLLTKTRQFDPKLACRMCLQLDVAKRNELGKFLISIAAADGEVSIHERVVLEAFYRDLGISHLLAPHLAEVSPAKPAPPEAVQLTTDSQSPSAQLDETNDVVSVTPPKPSPIAAILDEWIGNLINLIVMPPKPTPVATVTPPTDKASASYNWLGHVATGLFVPEPTTTKPSPIPLDHERIRRIEEKREKLSRSLSEVAQTDEALVEIRPSSVPLTPHEPIPPSQFAFRSTSAVERVSNPRSEPVPQTSPIPPVIAPSVTSRQAHPFVAPASPAIAPQPPRHRFDLDRIQRIEIETAKVADFLREAFREEDDISQRSSSASEPQSNETEIEVKLEEVVATDLVQPDVGVPAEESCSLSWNRLAPRFAPFVDRIARQPTWTRGDLDKLARELGLMLSGTIDTINEWADEQFGDFLLIDEGNRFLVQGELLIDVSRTT